MALSRVVSEIFNVEKCRDLEIRLKERSLKVIGTDTARSASYDFLRSIVTMGLSRTFTEIDGDFSGKMRKNPIPVYFAPPLTGFPLELDIAAWVRRKPE